MGSVQTFGCFLHISPLGRKPCRRIWTFPANEAFSGDEEPMRNNIAEIDWHQVCEVSCLRGTDGWNRLMQVREYLRYQSWCCCILDEFYACSINDVYLFLFEVDSRKEDVDRFVWVVCGNVPSLYLTTDCCPAPKNVFENYRLVPIIVRKRIYRFKFRAFPWREADSGSIVWTLAFSIVERKNRDLFWSTVFSLTKYEDIIL